MLAHALTSYAGRYGVLAGRSAVLATCHDGTYEDALFLAEKGMQITLLDARAKPCALHRQATEAGISVLLGCVPVNIVGGRCVAGVEIGHLGPDDRVDDTRQIIGCDVVGLSGGWSPVINLLSHRGVKPVWNERLQGFLGGKTKENIHMIGSADGLYDEDSVLLSAEKLAASLTGQAMNGRLHRGWSSPIRPVYEIRTARKLKAFIDPQHDVTTADIRQARLEGFTSVEHMKRYTTLGMATDQGRMGNVLGIAAMADALQQTIADTGITTFRPPFTPVSIGALAGRYSGTHWVPTRRTPMHHQHLAAGAEMTDAGLWKRPWYYPRDDETIEDAYIREAGTTRQTVGMVDVSTLGKIAVQGPDATEFLNRLYINAFAKLPVGRARYGVMLRDDGMVLDDGTTWRLADDDYFMTTTTAQAAPVMQFMEELLQTRWTDLRVHLTSVTDLWAGMAVAGPLARQLLSTAVAELDWSDAAFPFMAVRHSRIKLAAPLLTAVSPGFPFLVKWRLSCMSMQSTARWSGNIWPGWSARLAGVCMVWRRWAHYGLKKAMSPQQNWTGGSRLKMLALQKWPLRKNPILALSCANARICRTQTGQSWLASCPKTGPAPSVPERSCVPKAMSAVLAKAG